jgi:hypothetical protein
MKHILIGFDDHAEEVRFRGRLRQRGAFHTLIITSGCDSAKIQVAINAAPSGFGGGK